MSYKIAVSVLLALFGALTNASSLVEERRVERGKNQFQRFLSDERELAGDQYFLISLSEAIRPAEFDNLRLKYEMLPLSIHFCTMKGVLTIGVTPDESAVDRVAKTNLLSVMGANSRYVSPVELGGDLTPNDPKLCGFEAKMSADWVRRFYSDNDANILSIEIRDMKRRFFAVNHNLKEKK